MQEYFILNQHNTSLIEITETFMRCLLCARHCVKCITCINSFICSLIKSLLKECTAAFFFPCIGLIPEEAGGKRRNKISYDLVKENAY